MAEVGPKWKRAARASSAWALSLWCAFFAIVSITSLSRASEYDGWIRVLWAIGGIASLALAALFGAMLVVRVRRASVRLDE